MVEGIYRMNSHYLNTITQTRDYSQMAIEDRGKVGGRRGEGGIPEQQWQ